MKNEWAPAPPPRAPRKWPKRLLWTGAGLLVLLVVVYFVVTSSMFFEGFVLPRVNEALQAEVTVSSARISPFRRVTIRDLELKASRLDEPILQAREVTARYSLWSILRGDIRVREVLIDSPSINLIEYADGRRNIDAILESMSSGSEAPETPPPPPEGAAPLKLELERFLLTNATVRVVRHLENNGRDTLTVSPLHLAVTNLANGVAAGLHLGGGLRLDHVPGIGATNDQPASLRLAWDGHFECWMGDDLQPQAVQGGAVLDVPEATAAFADLAGLRASLETDLSLSRITRVQLAFQRDGAPLGRIHLAGPLSVARQEGRARLEISGIDRHALNLAGAPLGFDFGNTTLNATNDLQLSLGGQVIALQGNVHAGQLSVTTEGRTTVPLDFAVAYDVHVDQPAQTALVQSLTLAGHQAGTRVLHGGLSGPMKLAWSDEGQPLEESAFDLVVTNFNLADWSAFLGDAEGLVSSTLNVRAGSGGQRIAVDLQSAVQSLSVPLGTNRVEDVQASLRWRSLLDDFRNARVEECKLTVQHADRPIVATDVSGTYDLQQQEADIQTVLNVALPGLAGLLAQPDFTVSAGEVRFIASLRQKNLAPGQTNEVRLDQTVAGELRLVDFTGRQGEKAFQKLESRTDFQAALKDGVARLTQWNTTLHQNGQPGGTLALSGDYSLTGHTARVDLKLEDLNEKVLGSFLPASTNGPPLASIELGLAVQGRYEPAGVSALATELTLENLRLPGAVPNTTTEPVGLTLNLDASLEKGVARLRELTGDFTGRGQPAGRLTASGQYDLSNRTARATFNLAELDQQFLAPLLAQALGERSLSNAMIRVGCHASYNADGESTFDGEVRLANVQLHDPSGAWPSQPLEVGFKLNGDLREDMARMRLDAGDVRLGGRLGGEFSLEGSYNLNTGAGEGRAGVKDLNQDLLAPFVNPLLDGKELASLRFNTDLAASYEPDGESRLTGSLQASEFLIRDPKTNVVLKPLAAALDLNVGWTAQAVALDSVRVGLTPTVRARNELTLTGTVDLSEADTLGGGLKLVAESVDLTPYYDFFVAQPPPVAPEDEEAIEPKPIPETPKEPASEPATEPEAMTLPFRNFQVESDIGRFHLREIRIDDWQTKIRLNQGEVTVKPLAMTVNDAPFNLEADLNLGVPGYRYNVLVRADRVPLGPAANTFMPEAHDRYRGELITDLQIKGAGVTGPNLRSNLNGRVQFSLTNAVVKINQGAARAFLLPIAVLLRSPEMLKSAVTWVGVDVKLGEGKFHIAQAGVISPLFAAGTAGDIAIADDLMQSSLNELPVKLYLQRELARRARVLPRGTSGDDTYVRAPDFVSVIGTLAEPASKLDKLALSGSVIRSLVDPAKGTEEPTSSANPFDFFR